MTAWPSEVFGNIETDLRFVGYPLRAGVPLVWELVEIIITSEKIHLRGA